MLAFLLLYSTFIFYFHYYKLYFCYKSYTKYSWQLLLYSYDAQALRLQSPVYFQKLFLAEIAP